MFYTSMVMDNSDFLTTGYITVRVAKMYNAEWHWDLSDDTDIIEEFNSLKEKGRGGSYPQVEDYINCVVGSPMGTGRNYGMFHLPQVNSIGVVTFLDNSEYSPCWMGGFFRPIYKETKSKNSDRIIKTFRGANVPSDSASKEGVDSDGALDEEQSFDDSALIIRTKSTNRTNSGDSYDWEKRPTENLVVMDQNKIHIIHFIEWEDGVPQKYQQIEIGDSSEKISMKIVSVGDSQETNFNMFGGSFSLQMTDSGETTGIEGTTGESGELKLTKGDSSFVQIKNEEINISSVSKINISSETMVVLGKENYRLVGVRMDDPQPTKVNSLQELKVLNIMG